MFLLILHIWCKNVRRSPVDFFTNCDHTVQNFFVFQDVLNDIPGTSAHMTYSFSLDMNQIQMVKFQNKISLGWICVTFKLWL